LKLFFNTLICPDINYYKLINISEDECDLIL